MKFLFALAFLLPLGANAASTITCMDGHESVAQEKMIAAFSQGVAALLKQKGIAFDAASIKLEIDASVSDNSDVNTDHPENFGMFVLRDGSAVSKAGTPFSLDFGGSYEDGKYGQYPAYYTPVGTSSGHDHEGNLINPHCTLKGGAYSGYANQAEYITVTNSRSGVEIGQVKLPAALVLY